MCNILYWLNIGSILYQYGCATSTVKRLIFLSKAFLILLSHYALRREPVLSLTLFIELEKERSKTSEECQKRTILPRHKTRNGG